MKINVQEINTYMLIPVRTVGLLEGQIKQFAINLNLTQAINRAALRGSRIYQIGSVQEFEKNV